MRASLLNRVEYKQWNGASFPNSTFRPFAFSEPVPKGRIWIVLAVTAIDTFPGNENLFLLMVPPLSSYSQGLTGFFSGASAVDKNAPPVSQGVQSSIGGPSGPENQSPSGANAVNLMTGKFRRFVLPPEWALAVIQSPNGGGASGFSVRFSALIIEQSLN